MTRSEKDFVVGMVIGIVMGMALIAVITPNASKLLCEYSKYATSDYKITNRVLYCMSSDNGYQKLTKHKPRSLHMNDHK